MFLIFSTLRFKKIIAFASQSVLFYATILNLALVNPSIAQEKGQGKLYGILQTDGEKVKLEEVVEIDSANKEELYFRAKRWIIENFKSANDVIQLDDKQLGEIIAKGYFEANWQATFMHTYKVKIYYLTTIRLKDNKYKYELSNLRVKYYLPADKYSPAVDGEDPIETFNKARPKNAAKFIALVDEQIQSIISSLKAGMKKSEKKDW